MTLDEEIFYDIYLTLHSKGKMSYPRGLKVLEIENFKYTFPPYTRFINFESRKLNLNYIKQEFLWYLRGNKYDTSILSHAKIWSNLVNTDGSINSNYGQYLFGDCKQFLNVYSTLMLDKFSRRASIVILQPQHLLSNTKDVPCTYAINFRIRDNYLNMSVHMRSQDAIYGLGNDLPTFSFIHEMLFVLLKSSLKHSTLKLGEYYHAVDSFHVYEKHFFMLDSLVDGNDAFYKIDCPRVTDFSEVMKLIECDFTEPLGNFTKWLTTKD